MKLDELKSLWGEYHHQAAKKVIINKELLMSSSVSKIKSHLGVFKATAIVELVFNGLFSIYLLGFIADHWFEIAFAIPGLLLWLMVTAHFLWNIYSLARLQSVHYGLSITQIQKKINTLHLLQRYQIRSLYIAIPLFAVCFAIILPEALFGFSVYPYLGIQWYYQLLGTIALTPVIVWFVNKFPDQGMMKAQQFLTDIVKFEQTDEI